MGNEMENRAGNANEADTLQTRKQWSAPQLTAVSIAELTEFMLSPGSDGAATSTLS
jgi:hypothetical protein